MAFDLSIFNETGRRAGWPALDPACLQQQVRLAATDGAVRFERLMAYYRNDQREAGGLGSPVDPAESARPYVQAQEFGLPPRITGFRHDGYGAIFGGERVESIRRKEVVVENDIGWRIDTMVHFLFGQPLRIESQATDLSVRQKIQTALKAALDANGGLLFLQEMALLGHVHGFVDVLLRVDGATGGAGLAMGGEQRSAAGGGEETPSSEPCIPHAETANIEAAARRIVLELVEAARAVPICSLTDYRKLDYYAHHFRQRTGRLDGNGREESVEVTEVFGPFAWQRYHDRALVGQGANILGRIPVVHVQNMPRPFCYEGHSEVERLVPMQDELNTRLSDRANRISFQSFRMYLGRGIENFEDRPIAPGRMWSTDNPEASIQEFGGDCGSPSENLHIEQVREAMDKISGVPPVAAGLVGGRLGHLTSATALRVTLMSLLSKTAKKRSCYGAAVEQMCELILAWLDAAGVLATSPADRRVQLHWPPMLPESQGEKLQEALLKRQLGVPAERVLRELGYTDEVLAEME